MTDNIKFPPMPEPDRQAFERRMLDFGWRNFEGSISGSPPCWYYNNAELNSRWIGWREAVRLNAQAGIRALIADDAYAITFQSLGQYRSALLAALSAAPAAPQPAQPLTDEQIKRIMLDNGFTIKEGLTDLKPYVYAAARALIAAATGVKND